MKMRKYDYFNLILIIGFLAAVCFVLFLGHAQVIERNECEKRGGAYIQNNCLDIKIINLK